MFSNFRLIDETDDLESFDIDEEMFLDQNDSAENDFEKWNNLSGLFLQILKEKRERKSL